MVRLLQPACVTLFLYLCTPPTLTIFLLRPFLNGPVRVEVPRHNFWPWIPVASPRDANNDTQFFQTPDHNFWPFIPVNNTEQRNSTYFGLPDHNFWPFIPVAPPPKNRTRPASPEPPVATTPHPALPKPKHGYDYAEALSKSILFYEAQRSGWLPENRKLTWRGHSAISDKGAFGEDLSGGWYDAGDYVKFGFPMAGATSMLLFGLVEFRDAYEKAGLLPDMMDCVKWPLDYFVKAHPAKFVFYAQVADPYVDHSYWGRPEDMDMYRPAYKLTPDDPGSDIIGETAAAMAAGSIVFKSTDKKYSDLLLTHAQELFEFADHHRGIYSDSLPIVQEFYRDTQGTSITGQDTYGHMTRQTGYDDELSWAAAWLYKATRNERYLMRAEETYHSTECWAVSWDAKDCLAAMLLFQLTKREKYRYDIERTMAAWMPGGSVPYTPEGLAFRSQWGPLRYTANMAAMALAAANAGIKPLEYRLWARQQVHYMLGDAGRSYVIGFGEDYPRRPHHASSSCYPQPSDCSWSAFTSADPNPITLYGALVGGPSMDDSFSDSRSDYYQNEVTCDYNAGFQSAVAGLMQLEIREKNLQTFPRLRSAAHESSVQSGHRNTSFGKIATDVEKRVQPGSTLQRLLNHHLMSDKLQNSYPQPKGRRPKILKRQSVSRESRQQGEKQLQFSQPQRGYSPHQSQQEDPPHNDSAKREPGSDHVIQHWQKHTNTKHPRKTSGGIVSGSQSSTAKTVHRASSKTVKREVMLPVQRVSNKITVIEHSDEYA